MTQSGTTGLEHDQIDQSSIGPIVLASRKGSRIYLYDFAKQGGAVGTIPLIGDPLPKSAVVTNNYLDVIAALTTGTTSTAAVQIEAANDVVSATTVAGAPWSTTGLKDVIVEPGTESGYIKTTALRQPAIVIGTAALTAGKFYVVVEFDLTGA